MSIKTHTSELMRRRHNKTDDGFTLIELLVVIVIIAILSAVALIALLSAINSGRKSSAKSVLKDAVAAAKSVQSGLGVDDYTGVDHTTLTPAELDIKFGNTLALNATTDVKAHTVGAPTGASGNLIMVSRSKTSCYYVALNATTQTQYGSSAPGTGTCPATPTSGWKDTQSDGWKL